MKRNASRRGSALILVFWCLILLTLAVFSVVEITELAVEHTANHQADLQARAWAESGIAIALNPIIKKNDPLLQFQDQANSGFKVKLSSEAARFNLNFLLISKHREILHRLFSLWGLTYDEGDALIDSMTYWISTDTQKHPINAAIESDYIQAKLPFLPTHHNFYTFEEVSHVKGMDKLIQLKPDWKDSFTLWSEGPLNVNEADVDNLTAEFGIPDKRAAAFIEHRKGKDGIEGTTDDLPAKSMIDLRLYLGLTDLQVKEQERLVVFSDDTKHIESIGQKGARHFRINVVVNTKSNPPQFFLWSVQ